ncbi:HNH endonuclease, partial [Desertimonas flava]|uniref:HNH endonuclease n=2 Tax=Desertimonas flava TaxID=2064846 RepID=UPI0013C42854
AITGMRPASTTSTQIAQVALLERIVNASAGLRAEVSVQFAEATLAEQRDAGIGPRLLGRGIADELGLARGISPQHAASDMRLARQLDGRFPMLAAILRSGDVSERAAHVVARECEHLSDELARHVDARLSPQLPGLGIGKVETAARFLAIELDERGYLERHSAAVEQRCLTMRPVADGMVRLSGLVPMRDGVRAFGAIDRAARNARSEGDGRNLDQLRADLFVELLTGQRGAVPDTELRVTIPADSLFAHGSTPGIIDGYGPVPAAWVRELLDTLTHHGDSDNDNDRDSDGDGDGDGGSAAVWLRRVFTDPADDTVVAVDTHRRRFHPVVARWIRARDANVCRMPACDHTGDDLQLDHVDPYSQSHDSAVENGQTACASYNLLKELPGWTVRKHRDPDHPHSPTLEIITPTGRTYHCPPPPAFGPGTRRTPPWAIRQ